MGNQSSRIFSPNRSRLASPKGTVGGQPILESILNQNKLLKEENSKLQSLFSQQKEQISDLQTTLAHSSDQHSSTKLQEVYSALLDLLQEILPDSFPHSPSLSPTQPQNHLQKEHYSLASLSPLASLSSNFTPLELPFLLDATLQGLLHLKTQINKHTVETLNLQEHNTILSSELSQLKFRLENEDEDFSHFKTQMQNHEQNLISETERLRNQNKEFKIQTQNAQSECQYEKDSAGQLRDRIEQIKADYQQQVKTCKHS